MQRWLGLGSIAALCAGVLPGCGDGNTGGTGGASEASSASQASGATSSASSGGTAGTGGSAASSTSGAGGAGGGGGAPVGEPFVYVGGNGNLIRVFHLNLDDGSLEPVGAPVDAGTNPTFLAVDPAHRTLFAVNEAYGGKGAVASFHIDPKTGALSFLSRVSSKGDGPAHVSTDRTGKFAFVANYGGGTVAVLPIGGGGELGEAIDVHDHGGGSANPHQIFTDPANAFAFVPNKGLDTVTAYAFNAATGKLTDSGAGALQVGAGAGPRHLDIHPTAPYAYVINESSSTLSALSYDAATGKLANLQTLSTLPAGYQGSNTCAEVQVAPSGKFVYGSNRGHDSIAIFRVEGDGKLGLVGHQPTLGKSPRHFYLEPSGRLLLAANGDSGTIAAFHVDPEAGTLSPTGKITMVPSPAYVGVVYLSEP